MMMPRPQMQAPPMMRPPGMPPPGMPGMPPPGMRPPGGEALGAARPCRVAPRWQLGVPVRDAAPALSLCDAPVPSAPLQNPPASTVLVGLLSAGQSAPGVLSGGRLDRPRKGPGMRRPSNSGTDIPNGPRPNNRPTRPSPLPPTMPLSCLCITSQPPFADWRPCPLHALAAAPRSAADGLCPAARRLPAARHAPAARHDAAGDAAARRAAVPRPAPRHAAAPVSAAAAPRLRMPPLRRLGHCGCLSAAAVDGTLLLDLTAGAGVWAF